MSLVAVLGWAVTPGGLHRPARRDHWALGAGPPPRPNKGQFGDPAPPTSHAPAASDPAHSVIIIITSSLSIRSVISLHQPTAATELGATGDEIKPVHVSYDRPLLVYEHYKQAGVRCGRVRQSHYVTTAVRRGQAGLDWAR